MPATTSNPSSAKAAPHTAKASTAKSTATGNAGGNSLHSLVHTLEFAWFATHALVVLDGLLLALLGRTRLGGFLYRFFFVAAGTASAIVLHQENRGKTVGKLVPRSLVLDDNAQYLALSLLWLLTTRRALTPIPFFIFSLFHALTYARSYLLPALGYPTTSSLARNIESFVKVRNEQFTRLAASVELLTLVFIVFDVLTFRKGSIIALIGDSTFVRLRYAVSPYLRDVVKTWEVRLDNLLGSPAVKQYWVKFKSAIKNVPGPREVVGHKAE